MKNSGYVLLNVFIAMGCATTSVPVATRTALPEPPSAIVATVPVQVTAAAAWDELLEDAGGCIRRDPADFACAMELGVGLSLAITSGDPATGCSALEWSARYLANACGTQHVLVRQEIERQTNQLIAVCANVELSERVLRGVTRGCEPGEGNYIDDVAARHNSLRDRWTETFDALEHARTSEWFVLQRRLATIYLTISYLGDSYEMLDALAQIASFSRYSCESQDRWARTYIHAAFLRIGDGFRAHPHAREYMRNVSGEPCGQD